MLYIVVFAGHKLGYPHFETNSHGKTPVKLDVEARINRKHCPPLEQQQ